MIPYAVIGMNIDMLRAYKEEKKVIFLAFFYVLHHNTGKK